MLYPSLDQWIHMQLTMNKTMKDAVSLGQDKSIQFIVNYCGRFVEQVWWSASMTECIEQTKKTLQ